MRIEIPIVELRKRSLFLATPMYGGICNGSYTQSMINLAIKCSQHGIDLRLYYLFNESLIPRARAYAADEFMRSGCTHFMFIDADVSFDADAVISLLALQGDDTEYDVICAPYPKKTIAWEKIKKAVDLGQADTDPNNLENFVGDFVFNVAPGQTEIRLDQPVEVMESGTGFMMIRRKTFEEFDKAYPEMRYKPDHIRTDKFDGSREITMYFDCAIDPVSRRYLSEDYWFCQKVRAAGLHIWLCPWIALKHTGTYVFGGSLMALASINASLTADTNLLKNPKEEPKITIDTSPAVNGLPLSIPATPKKKIVKQPKH